jgi:hypothetical protein
LRWSGTNVGDKQEVFAVWAVAACNRWNGTLILLSKFLLPQGVNLGYQLEDNSSIYFTGNEAQDGHEKYLVAGLRGHRKVR